MWFGRRCLMMGHGRSDRGLPFLRRPEVGAELGPGNVKQLFIAECHYCRHPALPKPMLPNRVVPDSRKLVGRIDGQTASLKCVSEIIHGAIFYIWLSMVNIIRQKFFLTGVEKYRT